VREPTLPDPAHGTFTLEQAIVGMPVDGTLVAEIGTDLGTVFCDLYADKTPNTVANFIGLARGNRPWWDARAGAWVSRPYYRETFFHRVIPGYMIQGGDYLGDGTGTIGYEIPDELDPTLRHDRAGQLCMANTAPNKNGGQFFITDGPAPQLDADHTFTIFGQCRPVDIIAHIARVPQDGTDANRPLTPVGIARLFIRRVVGGAANATRTLPQRPPDDQVEGPGRNASPDPSELNQLAPPLHPPTGNAPPSEPRPRPGAPPLGSGGHSGATAPPALGPGPAPETR